MSLVQAKTPKIKQMEVLKTQIPKEVLRKVARFLQTNEILAKKWKKECFPFDNSKK